MDTEISYNDSTVFVDTVATSSDPLDLASLADFEDESALINDLLAATLSAPDESYGALSEQPQTLLELDVKLARLLGVLEHASSDTSAQVERAIEGVSRSVPRLTFDLQLMRENVTLLRFTLDSIRKRSVDAAAHSETSQVMRRLKVLDTIKTRMEAARDVLREAEAWSTLESEVTGLVQEKEYIKAAERLSEANKSMVVFQNTPEYEARRSLMVSLQNGLEAGLSASLVAAINSRDMQACQNYYGIFGQIQREAEFRNYYFGSRRAGLLKEWQAARLTDCATADLMNGASGASTPSQLPTTFSTYLPTFFTSLEKTISDERTYIPAIFPDPAETLSSFLQTTLEALSPSFPQRISDLSNAHGSRLLTELIRIYHATEEFAVSVERVFTRLQTTLLPSQPPMASPSSFLDGPPATPGRPHSGNTSPAIPQSPSTSALPSTPLKQSQHQQRLKRQSKGMSISRRLSRGSLYPPINGQQHPQSSSTGGTEAESQPIQPWETTLFEPFLDWQAEYADLESRLLRSELSKITAEQDAMAHLLSSSTSADGSRGDESSVGSKKGGARVLLDQTLAVFAFAEQALGRTMAFTHGYGAAGYVEAVDGTFKTFLLKERDTLLRVKDARLRRRRNPQATSRVNSPAPGSSASGVDEDVHMEYTQDDWSTIQLALQLLAACRTIWDRIAQLEQKVRTRLIDVSRLILRDARADPSNQIVPGTTRGALSLLWQSTLNSSSLVGLLESIDKQTIASSSSHSTHLSAAPLFSQARSASLDLTRASQLFLHDTILNPLMAALEHYASLPVWSQSSDSRPDSRGAFDLHIPTFSLSPSETITRVGEGFLNLPGMFEVYADDEALGFSLETLPDLEPETIKSLRKEQGQQVSPLPSPHLLAGHRHRPSVSLANNEFLPTPVNAGDQPPQASPQAIRISPSSSAQQQSNTALSAEIVISTWLSSITRSVLVHLTDQILPSIRSLSKHGAEQLLSDLGYLSNVARALDVEVEQVEKWRVALEYTSSGKKDPEEVEQLQIGIEDNEVVDVVKRMRARIAISR